MSRIPNSGPNEDSRRDNESSSDDGDDSQNPFLFEYSFKEVVGAHKPGLIRIYCHIRAHILRARLLREVGQYVPTKGDVAELGCGFGLFTTCFAISRPQANFHGCDLSEGRIREAKRVAQQLNVENLEFVHENALTYIEKIRDLQCVYMLDLLHHLPPEAVEEFLSVVWANIRPGGVLVIKDVSDKPWLKCAFTWILDVLMTKGEFPHYIPPPRLIAMLEKFGKPVRVHHLDDYLPYPHMLYILYKPEA